MILADTSVWIDHMRRRDEELSTHLVRGDVLGHAFVLGEIACGGFRDRRVWLLMLGRLPQAAVASHLEVMAALERQALFGVGIGFIDAHLLVAALLTPDARLWTRDRRLAASAARCGVAYLRH